MAERIMYAFADGQIFLGRECPRGALPIAKGNECQLGHAIDKLAERGAVRGEYFVPGVREAADQGVALNKLMEFHRQVGDHLLQA